MLSPLGALYALGWWGYQSVYSFGLKKPFEPHCPVVTVGNLIAGGTGKTPMTLFVATVLQEAGRGVVVSASGYGFPRSASASLAPDGELKASEWGDEAAMIRMFRPELPLIVGRDRVEAARIAHQHFPDSVLLMDDGFQHLRLRQHVTLLLAPETPNSFCLPAGPYREPRSTGLRRADLVLPGSEFKVVRSRTIGAPSEGLGPDKKVNVLCALGRPHQFLDSLRSDGYRLGTVRCLPDHDPLTAGTLLNGFDLETPLLVTAKDWVKLRDRGDLEGRTVLMAKYDVSVEPREGFTDWLRLKLDGLAGQTTA